jgi:GNAT superfamily N-acetyltransferase
MDIVYSEEHTLPLEPLRNLYRTNGWSSANHVETLQKALLNSHSLISVWADETLIGLGNAISDGFLVVYYPHLLILPEFQNQGIGSEIMRRLKSKYEGFHQHMLVADHGAIEFYAKCGFTRAGDTEPMWIYAGNDH